MNEENILAYKAKEGEKEKGEEDPFDTTPTPTLEQVQLVSHYGRVFEDLWNLHIPGHVKWKALRDKSQRKFSRSIPHYVQVRSSRCIRHSCTLFCRNVRDSTVL